MSTRQEQTKGPENQFVSSTFRPVIDTSSATASLGQAEHTASSEAVFPTREGQPLRVLFAVDSRFPGLGGAEKQSVKLAMALREKGVYVEFVTPRVLPSQPMAETFEGFRITRIDYPHIRLLGSLVVMKRFARYLIDNAHRFDAVHVHITHLMAAAAGYARSRSALPVTTKISGYYEFEGGVLDPAARFKPLNYLIRKGLTKVDFVQTISVQTRQKLLDAGFTQSQIQFVPNGIDIRQLPSELPSDDVIRIGYCGRLREVKGVHVLLDGFSQLKAAFPHKSLQLVIAGSGETQASLQEQAATLGIDADIEWLGTIENTNDFFRSIHLYVQPSFAEGLPNSVMEAMVAQRAVVATNIGGNNDLIEDGANGLLFAMGDAAALSCQLGQLIDDPELALRLALAGREHIINRYGFESVTRQMADLYLG